MVELNYQLECSIRPSTKKYFENQYNYGESIKSNFHFNMGDALLNGGFDQEYIKLEQTDINLERIAFEAVLDLSAMKVDYAEIAICPYLHTKHGMTQRQVVEATICGISRGIQVANNKRLKVKLCLSLLRNAPPQINDETVNIAAAYRKSGVVAVNVIYTSTSQSLNRLTNSVKWLKNDNIALSITCLNPNDVINALELNCDRITITSDCSDPMIVEKIKEQKVVVLANVSRDIAEGRATLLYHPIATLIKQQIVCIPCLGDRRFYKKPAGELILLRDKLRVNKKLLQQNEKIVLQRCLALK